jgi:hypothetical protein
MLSKIEAAFGQNRVWTLPELAAYVGVTPELVQAGVEQLKRMGRLTDDAAGKLDHCVNPVHHCKTCPFEGLCLEDETAPRKVTHVIHRGSGLTRRQG